MKYIISIIFLIFILVPNCNHNRVNVRKDARVKSLEEKRLYYFLFGIYPKYSFENQEICAEGDIILGAHFYQTFFDGIVSTITLGFIVPKKLEVYCGEDP